MQVNSNHNKKDLEFGVIILAGGKSSRMKFPKPWLLTNDKKTFAEKIIENYNSAGISEKIIVLNVDFCTVPFSMYVQNLKKISKLIFNLQPERGRLFSLAKGLKHVATSDFVFIQNVDAPFVSSDTIRYMTQKIIEDEIIIPEFEKKKGHPILIKTSLLRDLISKSHESSTLKQIILGCKKIIIPVNDSRVLMNINTIQEYEKLKHEIMA